MTISKDGRMNSIKTIVIIISLFVFLIAPANAVVSLKTKDGKNIEVEKLYGRRQRLLHNELRG